MTCLNCRELQHRLQAKERLLYNAERSLSAVRHLADRRLRLIGELEDKLEVIEVQQMTPDEQLLFHQRKANEPLDFY